MTTSSNPFDTTCDISAMCNSFPHMSLDELNNNDNEHISFQANQLVDIDLIDYCNITTDNEQGNALTVMDSYFRKKCSSLENINAIAKQRTTTIVKGNNNSTVIQSNYLLHISKSKSTANVCDNTPNSLFTSDILPKSFHFKIARYSKFNFDFLNFRNLNRSPIPLCFKFTIDKKLTNYIFEIQKDSLLLLPRIFQCPNLAFLIPCESGKYLIQLCCLPSFNGTKAIVPFLVNCYLNVVDLFVHRPFSKFSEQKTIEICHFQKSPFTQCDLFFRMAELCLSRPFVLKFQLERHSQSVTFATLVNDTISSKISCHYTNPWTCLMHCASSSNLNIVILVSNHLQTNDQCQSLSIYMCDSLKNEQSFLLQTYQIQLRSCPEMELGESCIQACMGDNNSNIILSKWKRIDLRNKDPLRYVKMNIHLSHAGRQLAHRQHWKCTQRQFLLKPLHKATIFVLIHKLPIEEFNRSVNGTTLMPTVDLCIDQFAGRGQEVTSLLRLTVAANDLL